jgi:hypothetical protein
MGPLKDLIAKLSGQSSDVTGSQSSALSGLLSSVSGIPNFGGASADAISKMFGMNTDPQIGMLKDAFDKSNIGLDPIISGSLNPYDTPGLSDALKTMTSDITNQVKGVYAGSGRDPSGAGSFAGSLGRGLTQGIAPVIASQFNTNVGNRMGALSQMTGNAANTATGITGQQQAPLMAATQGLGLIPALSGAYTAPSTTALGAANTSFSQPFQNIGALLGPLLGIAGLGGTSNGTATGTITQPQSLMSNIIGGGLGGLAGLSMLGGSGGAAAGLGSLSSLLPMLALSDERAKDDVEEVGKLHDGQKIVRFRYKGQPATQIGLLAQDVAKRHPRAVSSHGGMLMVDYKAATDRAANMRAAA